MLYQKNWVNYCRDQKEYVISFENGKTKKPIKFIKKTKKSGTKINFLPSKETFSTIKFSAANLQKKTRISFFKQRFKDWFNRWNSYKSKVYENKYDGGISEFVTFLDQKSQFW